MVLFTPVLQAHFFCSILHLCISDTNKNLLVQSVGLIGLLLDALFLADDHSAKTHQIQRKHPSKPMPPKPVFSLRFSSLDVRCSRTIPH